MQYNFDHQTPRIGTGSVKWEFTHENDQMRHRSLDEETVSGKPVLPLWVADMDFQCPAPVVEALVKRAQNGVYGYTGATPDFYAAVVGWMNRRHGWKIDPAWIHITPGIVSGLNLLVRAFAGKDSKVLVQPPVYPPFFKAIENNAGGWVANPLIYQNGRYRMDFDHLERVAADPQVTMALLCSPHNPVGRVWTSEELTQFGEICSANDVLIVSDEIHGDLILKGQTFTPFGMLDQQFVERAIICTAPSKTFNLAGLKTSSIIIQDSVLRDQFEQTMLKSGTYGTNAFGVVALQAAYTHGEEWLSQVLAYLQDNLAFLDEFLRSELPKIRLVRPEGTYLAWLDCRALGLSDEALKHLMLDSARVSLNDGHTFGVEGSGFQRLNFACPRATLQEALERIKRAVDGLDAKQA